MGKPRNAQRIDHVSMVYHPENVERAVATIERMLGLEFPPPIDMYGVRAWVDQDSGLEIVAPLERSADAGPSGRVADLRDRLYAHLEQRGEGLFSIVFGVADIDQAVQRAVSAGADITARFAHTDPDNPASEHFDRFEEVELGYVHGVNLILSHIEPKAEG